MASSNDNSPQGDSNSTRHGAGTGEKREGRKYWIYTYLFAKKDRENIEDDELARCLSRSGRRVRGQI
ncbi:hypothetical protein J2S34_002286 [Nitrobacter winogradskyi]|uniref:Uncharacterized protein n=2 Tax=Nitrobacter winogradskyi TaxID=913 RepID=A0ACC6AJA5_NITWI|nr:hypothetical protein [Nitrobacter winogradskyi]GEC17593.1 hypothetical protein NWI01_34850 [Nitrobacter winogradskyi]